ncbi:MAG: hypothetical protein M0R46_15725 [Candidatus Muirbacterium halophilum]|nr:hypothetical protein [Candidatus Muirbacterium halophilum]MCK9477365.1 hypothetical protein [Candidatus Muirbacterium halophilum]
MKIDCVICDLGKVLVFFDHFISAQKISKFTSFSAQKCYDLILPHKCVMDFGKGNISAIEFYKEVCKVLEINTIDLNFEDFKKIWADIFTLNKQMIDFIKEYNVDKKILLSNTDEIHFEWIDKKWGISELFDEVILSYKARYMKPEDGIFDIAMNLADCNPKKILYIDDIKEYTQAFAEYGVNCITYNADTFKIDIEKYL